MIYTGVVEDVNDPLKNGRVRVRVFGLHTDNSTLIKVEDLPWASVQQNNSASVSGIGTSPTGLVPGSWVNVDFYDEDKQYPVVLGSIPGIPSHLSTNVLSYDDLSFNVAEIETDENAKIRSGIAPERKTTQKNNDPYDLTGMSRVPPKGTPRFKEASANIEIIIAECIKQGIRSRNGISSILGVIGGESMWTPVVASYKFSASRLVEVFPSVFPTISSTNGYANNEEALPERLYGVGTSKGRALGNTLPGDGSRFIDRGFIQLLGRYNYNKYGNLVGINLIDDPKKMLQAKISATVSIAYILDRVKVDQLLPGYFDEVKRQIGHNTPDIATKKKNFYDYFMAGVETSNGEVVSEEPVEEFDIVRSNSTEMYGGTPGFRDPNGQFPRYYDEPDTNRLARGEKTADTIVAKKNSNRIKGIESVGKTWSEQVSPYNASYPNNRVLETNSGHVMEFDDSPGAERIHVYHRTGTYFEIDNTGSRTTRIVGSSYEIIDRNGHIFINGAAHVTVGGNANINVGGDLNAKVG